MQILDKQRDLNSLLLSTFDIGLEGDSELSEDICSSIVECEVLNKGRENNLQFEEG